MTSHLIDLFDKRAKATRSTATNLRSPLGSNDSDVSDSGRGASTSRAHHVPDCTFCEIASGQQEAFTVYEDEHVLAFLDILPIRRGHLLVIPKSHYERVSHLPDDLSAQIGRALPRISRALCRAVAQPDYNIVSNQGHAQVVPHVHYHLVPAPSSSNATRTTSDPITANTSQRSFPWSTRTELDDEEGQQLAQLIRVELDKEEKGNRESQKHAKL